MPTRSWSDVSRAYRYGFNGKEKDFETANDNYDFGARIYDGRLGRWLSVDPESYLYISFSSYFFSYNNPISFKDADGRRIYIYYETQATDDDGNLMYKFDPETGISSPMMKTVRVEYKPGLTMPDNKFVSEVIEALDHMQESRRGRRQLSRAMNASEEIKIVDAHNCTDKYKNGENWSDILPWWGESRLGGPVDINKTKEFKEKFGFWPSNFTIYWNPKTKLALKKKNELTGKTLSASMSLIHEIIHVNGAIRNYIKSILRLSKTDSKYDSKEERRTIRIERKIARDLNQSTRWNHDGASVPNSGVTESGDVEKTITSTAYPGTIK